MLTSCGECGGQVSTRAPRCPHCGADRNVVLEGKLVPPAAASRAGRRVVRRRFVPQSQQQESPAALVCGIIGLIIPILSLVAIILGKKGKPGFILGVVGASLWGAAIILNCALGGILIGLSRAT